MCMKGTYPASFHKGSIGRITCTRDGRAESFMNDLVFKDMGPFDVELGKGLFSRDDLP